MNINKTIAAVIRAPLLAGDSIPNMANTEKGGREREERERERDLAKLTQGISIHIHTRLTDYDHDHTEYLYS